MAPLLSFNLRTPDERFKTYLSYVKGAAQLCGERNPSEALSAIVQSRQFRRIQGGKGADVEAIGRILRIAWFTELQLGLASSHPEIVPYANHWAPVQAYYCAYLGTRAYFESSGQHVPKEHRATLTTIAENIATRPELFDGPFASICTGDAEAAPHCFAGIPQSAALIGPSLLADDPDPWFAYTTFLRTTRERRLDDLAVRWKQENDRMRVPNGFRNGRAAQLPPTTILDCLYRLRVRSNYSHADDFISSAFDTTLATKYNESLIAVTWRLLLNLELLVARYLGKRQFQGLVDQAGEMHQGPIGLAHVDDRWELIRAAF